MAFKSFNQYQEDKNGDFFVLLNDMDSADVVFLYRSTNDVLVADTHYINSATYKGYVHCCGLGCPACSYGDHGIKIQTKIFIPLFNITKNKIEFWDRTTYFESILQSDVFKNFPNPSECVFRITRRGVAGSRETKYEIRAVGRNTSMPYEKILADFNMSLPEGYSKVCREMSPAEMSAALNSGTGAAANLGEYGYTPVPRGSSIPAPVAPVEVPTPIYSAPPTELPDIQMPEYVPSEVPVSATTSEVPEEAAANSDDDIDNVAF